MVSTPELDSIVGGKYRLVRALGAGGMGTVYEAENILTLKHAAIKWVHPQYGSNAQAYQRVIQEARASSRIRHENVVDVYDVLQEGDSIFLVMELLVGEPLAERIAREPPPMHELVGLLLPALRGLAAAHDAGVVHRDIKPDNIFLAQKPGYRTPVPKIIDFGISKVFEGNGVSLTRSGVTMGTPRYVSYEQLVGARDVDARTDVYACGVILYEALTGRAPYDGAKTFGEQAVYFATIAPPPPRVLRNEIPEALEALVMRAIAKEREERLPSLKALMDGLEPFAELSSYPTSLSSFPARAADELALAEAPTTPTPTPARSASQLPSIRPETQEAEESELASPRGSLPVLKKRRAVALEWFIAATLTIGAFALWLPREGRYQRETTRNPGQRTSLLEPSTQPDPATGATAIDALSPSSIAPADQVDPEPPAASVPASVAPPIARPPVRTHAQSAHRQTESAVSTSVTLAIGRAETTATPEDAGHTIETEQDIHRAGRVRRQEF